MTKLYGINLAESYKYKPGRSKKKKHAYKRLRRAGFTPLSLMWFRK